MSDRPSVAASILIVEDDDVGATDLQDKLIDCGYSVRLTASVEAALEAFETTPADLILLGLILPDTDGLIACSAFKARTAAPIIVMSGRPREVDRVLALELGASDFLAKPVDFDELQARIEAVIADPRDFGCAAGSG